MFWSKKTPTLDSLRMTAHDWSLAEESDYHRTWAVDESTAVMLRFHNEPPTLPYDISSVASVRAFYAAQTADASGAAVDIDVQQIHNAAAMIAVMKYRQERNLGAYITGVIAIPFRDVAYQFNVESSEVEVTGMRETMVTAMQPVDRSSEREMIDDGGHLFQPMAAASARRLLSDDAQFDKSFPDHPLSKVRALQRRLLETIAFDESLRKAPPFVQ
jgi:hypothetical protein